MCKIKLLIVLYNRGLFDSETCLSVLGLSAEVRNYIEEIFVWNNSSIYLSDANKHSFDGRLENVKITYIEDGINHPLSIVYNAIIARIDEKGILVLFDHDSIFGNDYILCLLKSASENPQINLFLPQIYYSNKLISPARQIYFYGRYLKKIECGKISSRYVTAINSGMAIRCRYLKNDFPLYDEEIKFYGTDNDFMWKYSCQNKELFVLDTTLSHTLNYYVDEGLESKLLRFRDIKNGIKVQMKKVSYVIYCMSLLYLFLYSCKMALRYKTFAFFR